MTKKEQYALSFIKISDNLGDMYICTGKENVQGSLQLASLLRSVSDKEPDGLLEEVALAIAGGDYEEYYSPDGSAVDTIKIVPPNAIYNDYYTVILIELKQLLQEWISFIES